MSRNTSNIQPAERIALRVNDACAVAGLSRSKLYDLMKDGRLKAIKVGGRRLILRDDLKSLLAGGC
ncbi:MAG: helix-turn-helix domain-containing protein [Beijerinckiaceae bacterium]